jgi:L-lactate dehydrogenase complex protein LldG
MASNARVNILARVRQAQVWAHVPETKAGLPDRLAYPQMDLSALRKRLQQELELLGVQVFSEDSAEEVRVRVKDLITGKSLLSWNADQLPYELGVCLQGEKVYYGRDSKEDQGQAEIGLTGCEAALAETGTLALISAPGKPRTASLLPYIHVVVIRSADILLGMGQFLEKFKHPMPYMVFITGPSRTADIELSLTLGVHGPGKVLAVIGP